MSKQHYETPRVIQSFRVGLERNLLIGSIVDWIYPVETAGQGVDQFVDYSFTSENEFNHTWGE